MEQNRQCTIGESSGAGALERFLLLLVAVRRVGVEPTVSRDLPLF